MTLTCNSYTASQTDATVFRDSTIYIRMRMQKPQKQINNRQ